MPAPDPISKFSKLKGFSLPYSHGHACSPCCLCPRSWREHPSSSLLTAAQIRWIFAMVGELTLNFFSWFFFFLFWTLDFGLVNTLQTLANGLSFTLLGGLPLTPCSMEKLVGFFKQCQKCRSKLPPLDGYSLCLPCLGETHRVDSCPHGARFLKQARKNQVARMQIVLTTAALTALMSSSVPSQDRVITHHLDTKAALGL